MAEKATKLAENLGKSKAVAEKVRSVAVNIVAGGAAIGVAMKDFGLVKKQVSDSAENLVERSIDNANGNDYNSSTSTSNDFTVSDDEF